MAKGLSRTWRFELGFMSLHAVRPRILGFISEDASAWLVALLVLLIGGVLTGLLAWSTLNLFHHQLRQRFQLLASERYSRIEERFEDQEQRLDGLRRFFANSGSVSRAELTATPNLCCCEPKRIPMPSGSLVTSGRRSSDGCETRA